VGKIDLSIIIVSYNTKNFLKNCLESIEPNPNYEIIVIDNNSTDGSVLMLKELKKRSKQNITILEKRNNLGFAKANNQALKKAQGRLILFLNPDTILEKETLKTMIDFMDENPKVGAATCRVQLTNGKLDQASHRGFPTVWNSFTYFSGLEKLFPKSPIFAGYSLTYLSLDNIHEIDSGCGAFLMVRQEAGNQVNWFDEDYFWYGEDLDFCYRLKENGWKIMFVPTTKITHWKGAASGIKKHSQGISTASKETKIKAAKASIKVMRLFFQKHYQHKYPKVIYWLTMLGISLLEKVRLFKVNNF